MQRPTIPWQDVVPVEFAQKLERGRNAAIDALQYIAHSGLSARHLSKFALDFLNDKSLCPSQNAEVCQPEGAKKS